MSHLVHSAEPPIATLEQLAAFFLPLGIAALAWVLRWARRRYDVTLPTGLSRRTD